MCETAVGRALVGSSGRLSQSAAQVRLIAQAGDRATVWSACRRAGTSYRTQKAGYLLAL
jgi:hypothetical protein